MALTKAQAAVVEDQPIAAGVLNTLAINSPVLDRLPFMNINGNSYSYRSFLALPGVEFRAVNAAYSESTGTYANTSESLVILGGDADVDDFLIATQGQTTDLVGDQIIMKTLSIAYKFQDTFINGDTAVDANSFDGLKKRLTGAQVIDMATNGAAINTDATTRMAFYDKLDALIDAVPGATPENSAFYMPSAARSALASAMRSTTIQTAVVESFGKRTFTYNEIPVLNIGNKADGTPIIPYTETQGSSSVASSIYLVKFGNSLAAQGVTGLQANELRARRLGELQTKPVQRVRIDWYPGLALFGGKAAARLRGVLAG